VPSTAVDDWAALKPIDLELTLGPRFARRLRCKAKDAGRSPQAMAAILLANALVPDAIDRARLIQRELREARGTSPTEREASEGDLAGSSKEGG